MSPDQTELAMFLSQEWLFDIDDNIIENIKEILIKRFPELLEELLEKSKSDE
ncbi:hypothetical protein D3C72_1340980 [compost metagenome]